MSKQYLKYIIFLLLGVVLYLFSQQMHTPTVLTDPTMPPLKQNETPFQLGVPINVETRSLSQPYSQMGIIYRNDTILPLMGRQFTTHAWQYYAISNTGVVNTKLPIVFRGKKGSSEYGCDEITTGDVVYVDGYKDTFQVTIYDNEKNQYIPYI